MKGSIFKRCTQCAARVNGRRCDDCGSDEYTWGFVVDVGRAPDGRRLQRHRQGFDTRDLAEKALVELLHKVHRDEVVEPSSLTLARFLEDEWLPAVRPPNLRQSTYNSYEGEMQRHVIPHLGGVRLQKLHAVQLNKLYAHLLAEGRMDGDGGLSPRTVRYIHVILRRALKDAVRWGRLERNPADLADPPKQSDHRTRDITTWSADELATFLDHVADGRLSAAWRLIAMTGMRRGELLGLRWVDVDLEHARLAVRQAYVSVDGHGQFSPPKTRKSRRTIDLDTGTVQALRDWAKLQQEEADEWGDLWEDHGLVFTQENGRPLDPDHFSQDFVKLSRAAGLKRIRLHDLRHTHATLLLASGTNVKVVSERLGHHSTAFTMDTYTHAIPGMQADAAEQIADLVRRERDATDGETGDEPADREGEPDEGIA